MAARSEDSFANFITWSVRAMGHAWAGLDEDALLNVRKAGEAAAKTIIAHQWPGPRAEEAIAGARFAHLIHTIIRGRLAPKSAILLLQTLQVEGNVGSHDQRVRRGRVALGLAALQELSKWLCADLLGRSMPTELRAAFEEKRDPPPTAPPSEHVVPALQEERMAGIESALQDLSRRTLDQRDAPDPAVIEAINALHARLDAMERPQQEGPAPPALSVPGAVPTRKRRSWKWMAFAAVVLAVIGTAWWSARREAEVALIEPVREVAYDPSALNVLILPLTVVQDDPGLRLDIPAAIANRLQKRIAEYPWKAYVVIDTVQRTVTPTPQEAWEIGRRYGASLVIYGDLLEPTGTDSGRVIMGHVMHVNNALHTGEWKSDGFRTMADPAIQHGMNTSEWWFDRTLTERMVVQGAYSQALTVLQHASPAEAEHETTRRMLMAQCFAATGNIQAALREATWCREQGVSGAVLHAFLAELHLSLGDRAAALKEAEQAVKQAPTNTGYMMVLADLLVDPIDLNSAKGQRLQRLVEQVLKADPSNAHAWFAQAVIHSRRQEWDASIRCYERTLELEPTNADAKAQLANVLAQQKIEPQRALQLVNEVIAATDSTHVKALELAANIRIHTALADGPAASRLLRKVEQLQQGDRPNVLLSQGQAALMAGDHKQALTIMQRCWPLDSGSVRVADAYALALMKNGKYSEGMRVAQQGLAVDPLDSRLNALLGEAHLIGPAALYDPVKGEQYLTAALRTDMHDPYVLNLCGETRLRLGNAKGAASVINAAYRLTPDEHRTNRNMGNVKETEGDLKAASVHYRRALELDRTDDETASNLAFVLLKMGPGSVQEGLHWSQRSVDLVRSPENLMIHARLLLANRRRADSEQAYREAIATRPELRQADLEQVFGKP